MRGVEKAKESLEETKRFVGKVVHRITYLECSLFSVMLSFEEYLLLNHVTNLF